MNQSSIEKRGATSHLKDDDDEESEIGVDGGTEEGREAETIVEEVLMGGYHDSIVP